MSRQVAIVPHTHWDREWYEPFQTFRLRLVTLLDELLDLLESDPSYTCFMLDGQMAVVDDYLDVRPEAEPRIRALAAAGRLTMGPWYILLDEFLVSGETIVRDLQLGLSRGAAFGGAMELGYLPDMFGHIAQMPQILALAGFEHAVVWRGVPSEITSTGFWWEAPDGSTVRAEYLPVGYGNAAALPNDAKTLVQRIADHEQEIGEFLIGGLLAMNGTDHQRPQPWLGRVVAEANEIQDDFRFEITSIPRYLTEAPVEGLPRWRGELRSGARANVLMGVTSNRVDIKRAAMGAERALERRAEPLAALFQPAGQWPASLLDLAWLGLVRNSAHDSICACSVDEVNDAVLHRYAESRAIADGLAGQALDAFARSMADPGHYVVNLSSHPRSGVVELVVSGTEEPTDDVQVISERMGLPGAMTLDANTVRTVLGMIQGTRIDDDAWVQDVRIEEDETGIDLTVTIGSTERPGVPVAEMKQDLYTRLGARPDVAVRVRLDQPPIRRIAARAASVPGLGWATFEPVALADRCEVDVGPPVVLSNGLVTVEIDPTDGTFSVAGPDGNGMSGYGRLVDGGDLGDSYNYSPPRNDLLVDRPESVIVTCGERGPVRATAIVTATYRWPEYVDGGSQSRRGERTVEVATVVELRAHERTVRVSTSFVNPSRDHRVRVHLPLPEPAAESEAESAFGTVTRGLTVEGRPDERGLPTFPARRFVSAGRLTVVHEGVCEYELVDIEGDGTAARARTLALTVLRSTGMLSRLGMSYRPFPAGPLTPVHGLQMVDSAVELRYALVVGEVDPWKLADDVLLPLEVVGSFGGGDRLGYGQTLAVEGAEVSAVLRRAGTLEVRVFNPADSPTTVRIPGRSGWLVDLRGRPTGHVEGSFELRAHGIATFELPES